MKTHEEVVGLILGHMMRRWVSCWYAILVPNRHRCATYVVVPDTIQWLSLANPAKGAEKTCAGEACATRCLRLSL